VLLFLENESAGAFADNLAAADAILSTSVAEGFGMVFLESWLAERPLVGRDLPEITRDFVQAGVDLSSLAASVQIPADWVDVCEWRRELGEIYGATVASYTGRRPAAAEIESATARLAAEGTIDFAMLPAAMQADVIRQVAGDSAAAETLLALNPSIRRGLCGTPCGPPSIAANRAAVEAGYSHAATGRHLAGVHRWVKDSRVDTTMSELTSPQTVLDSFLDIHRLNPIRVE